jgi:hypothetical protein
MPEIKNENQNAANDIDFVQIKLASPENILE